MFHHAKAESKPSKGLAIKFIALHEWRKNKEKKTIEIKIKKKVDLILFNFEKVSRKLGILSVKKMK